MIACCTALHLARGACRRPRVMPDGQSRAGQVSTSANAKALNLVVEGA
jgi:hypothetical protein